MVLVFEVLMVDLLSLNIYVMLDVVGYPRLNNEFPASIFEFSRIIAEFIAPADKIIKSS